MNVVGPVCGTDPALSNALSQYKLKEQEYVIRLLPEAFSSCMAAADVWKNSNYITTLEAFAGNEHAMCFALSRLLPALYPSPVATEEGKRYLSLSSQTLIELRLRECSVAAGAVGGANKETAPPLRAMTLLPDMFLQWFPQIHRSYLESLLPFSLLHSSQVTIHTTLSYVEECAWSIKSNNLHHISFMLCCNRWI